MKNLLTRILNNLLTRCHVSHVSAKLDSQVPSFRAQVVGHSLRRLFKTILGLGLLLLSALSHAQTSQVYYIHTDHLNTPRLLSDNQGRERWRWEQAEGFGSNAPNEQPTPTQPKVTFNLRYPGQYFDTETATYYNYFRDYNPQTGRYTTSDPIGLQGGINTYTYVENQPLKKIDPTGENAVVIGAEIGGAVAGPPGAAVGIAVGLLANYLIVKACKKDDDGDRCKRQKSFCISQCLYNLDFPGRKDNTGPFYACIRRCMEAAGCNY